MLKTAFGKQAMGRSQTFQWFSQFKAGRTSIDDEECSGWPVSSSTPEMIEWERQTIRKYCRTTDEVSMLLGISHGTCHKILTEDLKMRCVTSKFVPRLLIVDNAPTHATPMTQQVLTNNSMTLVPHPPYSTHLATCEFFLFPKLIMKPKGQRFQTVEKIQAKSQAVLNTLYENDFQECFKKWQRRWDHCQFQKGDYFEGDACP